MKSLNELDLNEIKDVKINRRDRPYLNNTEHGTVQTNSEINNHEKKGNSKLIKFSTL